MPAPMIHVDARNSALEMSPWTNTMARGAANRADNDTTNAMSRKGRSGTSASSATVVVAYHGQYVGEMSNRYANHSMAAARSNPNPSVTRRASHVTQTNSASTTNTHTIP